MSYIPRSMERILQKAESSFKAVLLTGTRQTGKSTLLRHLHADMPYLSFDDPLLRAQTIREPGLFFRNHLPPVILDEVQYISDSFSYIKLQCDRSDARGQVLMTGSQPFHLMRQVSESLAGRVAILEMNGLSLREMMRDPFAEAFLPDDGYAERRKKTVKNTVQVWDVIHRGSYPELTAQETDWQMFFSSYVRTYLERDINDIEKVRDHLKFTRFLSATAARTGQMLNYSTLAEQADITPATAKAWISLLETSGIVFLLQPYSNSALHRAVKTPKLYFRDTGLACYLTGHQTASTAMNGAMAGGLFETFVMSEILKSYTNAGLDYRMYMHYYRGKDKKRRKKDGFTETREAEIDLLLERDGVLYPVEIKMSANPRLEMTDVFDVLDLVHGKKRGPGTVVCMYDRPLMLNERNRALPVEYL